MKGKKHREQLSCIQVNRELKEIYCGTSAGNVFVLNAKDNMSKVWNRRSERKSVAGFLKILFFSK